MRTDRKDLFKHRFQKHYPRLCSIAYGYVLDRDESEDTVQEVFINIWDKGKDDLPEQEFLAYLTTAVKNNCISFLRKRKDSPASLEDYPLADSHPAEEDHHGEESHRSAEEIVEDALGTLPPKCKDIFVMAKLKGMKYREIAQTLNLSEKTIENQMSKAIKMLRTYAAANPLLLIAISTLVLSIIVNS